MAFSSILRRSARRFTPLAIRAIGGQGSKHNYSVIFSSVNRKDLTRKVFPTSFPSLRHFSTKSASSDESLIRVLEYEIKCAEESDDQQVEDDSETEGFPFTIQDNPGLQTISLTRQCQGETINVEVHMPDIVTGEEGNEDDDNDAERRGQSHIPLVVRVSKKEGPYLEFGVAAYPDEIAIDCLSVRNPKSSEDQIVYEGPQFSDLDANLQKAFHKYLEIRGIKPSTTNFLHEYMINKDSREYLMWLKNVKKFIVA